VSFADLQDALKSVKYPGFSRDIVSFGIVRSADVHDGRALIKLAVTTADPTVPRQIKTDVERAALATASVRDVLVEIAVIAPKAHPLHRRDRQWQGRRGQVDLCRQPRLRARASPRQST
jgi:ATP-binding protein involved in chromosome partitioning